MAGKTVGISILTNSDRLEYLKVCIDSLLKYCYYRPLIIGIYNNGSTDSTKYWLNHELPKVHGVEWKVEHSDVDIGCSKGTNKAMDLVRDCEYAIHVESDFIHMNPAESGDDRMWLHRAVDFMDSGKCDFLYLRRMRDEQEMMFHFWSQWAPKIVDTVDGKYMKCPEFWFSQNPALRRNDALYDAGTLPMPEFDNDNKSNPDAWNKGEMGAVRPPNPWIHKFGMFAHEKLEDIEKMTGCGLYKCHGNSSCKYGFYMNTEDSVWCLLCDANRGYDDMNNHEGRFRQAFTDQSMLGKLRGRINTVI